LSYVIDLHCKLCNIFVNWDSISAPSAKPPRTSKDHFSQLVQMVLFRGDKIGV